MPPSSLQTLGSSQGSSLLYAKLAVGGIFQVAGPPAGQAPSLPSVYSSGTTEIGIDNGGQMLVQGSDYNADSVRCAHVNYATLVSFDALITVHVAHA